MYLKPAIHNHLAQCHVLSSGQGPSRTPTNLFKPPNNSGPDTLVEEHIRLRSFNLQQVPIKSNPGCDFGGLKSDHHLFRCDACDLHIIELVPVLPGDLGVTHEQSRATSAPIPMSKCLRFSLVLAVRDVVATAHRTDVLNETNEPPKARSGWHAAEVHRFSSTVRPVLYRPESKRLPSCVHSRAATQAFGGLRTSHNDLLPQCPGSPSCFNPAPTTPLVASGKGSRSPMRGSDDASSI